MFDKIKKIAFYIEKGLTGTLGNGVSYEKQKMKTARGLELERAIEAIATKNGYKVVSNLFIPVGDTYTEIDVVVIGVNGLFVIEAKNYNALIQGRASDKQWKASYNNGQEYRLYNPIKQNQSHINALRKYIKVNCMSIVVFSDSATLRITDTGSFDVINVSQLQRALAGGVGKLTTKEIESLHKKLSSFQTSNPLKKINQKRNAVKQAKRK